LYFDYAATTPIDEDVLSEMMPYLTQHWGNPSSIHKLGRTARAAIEKARKTIATSLNCSTSEIFFTSGGTEAANLVFRGAIQNLGIRRIITSPIEHHCVTNTAKALSQQQNIAINWLHLNQQGQFEMEELIFLLKNEPKIPTLVSLMHVNNELGNITNIEQIGEICNQYGAFFHTDAVQSFGFMPLSVQQIGCHFLSGSGHKLYAPKGIGFLYVNSQTTLPPLIYGGSQERNMRAGTENVSGIVGLGAAAQAAHQVMPSRYAHLLDLKQYFRSQLLYYFPDITINGIAEDEASAAKILNVTVPVPDSGLIVAQLDVEGLYVSGGSACSSGAEVKSYVLEAIGSMRYPAVRFSFGKNQTKSDIDEAIAILRQTWGSGAKK